MIESITIKDFATYSKDTPQKLDGLSKVNFLFGSNGAGKTVISQIIDNESKFSECKIAWKGGEQLETMVYNRDFVKRNFSQSTEIQGVFTLGEEQQDTLDKISSAKEKENELRTAVENLTIELQGNDGFSGKKGELAGVKEKFKMECWSKKQKYDEKFKDSFQRFRGDREKFKEAILHKKNTNEAELLAFAELEEKTKSVFGENMEAKKPISTIDADSILSHETKLILKKKVIGKEDVDIAAMINKLGNSDWVQKGRDFYNVNDEMCPFCQQKTDKEFSDSLNEYFDDTFQSDIKAIEDIKTNYVKDAGNIQKMISLWVDRKSEFLDMVELKSKEELLLTKINSNIQKIAEKQRAPSQIVELDSLATVLDAINSMIDTANQRITVHNNTVANIKTESDNLISQVWRFVVDEMKYEIKKYEEEENNLNNIIATIKEDIKNTNECRNTKLKYIYELEKKTTSVQPTIDRMNRWLELFGFRGFNFAKVGETSYKIVRSDGSDVEDTLSEGEKNFVTFLYFYHLIKGSNSDSGVTTDKIVVFDDPVSSIDSDILFIVSSLIKDLFNEVNENKGHIKQVFVLTHNVYFHKEVSYNTKKGMSKNMKFWIVRKPEQYSKIEFYNNKNPVETLYQLLWKEVRESQSEKEGENIAIQNTLRRILEYYFRILGSFPNYDEICEKFDKIDEKIVCKSLVAWLHKGSHFADEDMYVSNNDLKVGIYLKVFKDIFCKLGHKAHYTMMMSAPINEPIEE